MLLFVHWQHLDFDVADRHFFPLVRTLIVENVCPFWMDFQPNLFCAQLKSHNIFCSCSRDVAIKNTSSANLKFVRQSDSASPSCMPMPFFRQLIRSSFNATCSTVLKNKLDNGSPCFVPFFISNTSLSLSVKTDPFCLSYSLLRRLTHCDSILHRSSAFQRDLWLIESQAFMKSYRPDPHFDTPLLALLLCQLETRQMVQRLVGSSNPPWSPGCTRSSLGFSLLYRSVENNLCNAGRVQIGR